jgi:hypothetical protein
MKKIMSTAALAAALAVASGAISATQAKEGVNPPGVNPNHYRCYKVSEERPFATREVTLKDQFDSGAAKVLRAVLLCAPVQKNRLTPRDTRTHLVCYDTDGGQAPGRRVSVDNQFGPAVLKVDSPTLLCVPSLKRVLR